MATFSAPHISELKEYSDRYGFGCSDEELQVYQKFMAGTVASAFQRVWAMSTAPLPVKYPRTQGYRPPASENPLNAWYYKCLIKGKETGGKLQGVRVAVKDNVCVAGIPLMNGSRTLEGFVPDQDATVITRLLDEGASIVGKSTCEDLCLSGGSFHTTYGPVRNPWNPARTAGGSSSGSAALVAAGEVDLALGGDQGGSIRIPSSSCGIVGLKPTYGLVPYTGTLPIETTIDHVGPMARTVKECALMLEVLAGYDASNDSRQPSTGFPAPVEFSQEIAKPVADLKVGILKEGFEACEKDVVATVEAALRKMKSSGAFALVEEVSVPSHVEGHNLWAPIGFVGGVNQMIDGHGYGTGAHGHLMSTLSEKFRQGLRTNARTLSHTSKMIVMCGAFLKDTYGMSVYAKAQTCALELRRAYDRALEGFDVLVLPTLNRTPCEIPAPDADLETKIGRALDMLVNTCPFNLTHHPALTVNAGFSPDDNMPVGLQIVGRHWEDATVLRVGRQCEDLFGVPRLQE